MTAISLLKVFAFGLLDFAFSAYIFLIVGMIVSEHYPWVVFGKQNPNQSLRRNFPNSS
jgi:hypothetical protein